MRRVACATPGRLFGADIGAGDARDSGWITGTSRPASAGCSFGTIPRLLRLALVGVGVLAASACEAERQEAPRTEPVNELPGAPTPPEPPERLEVSVYFTRDEEPVRVTRSVPHSPAVLQLALEALLAGPTQEERAAGISSWFSDETASMLMDVRVEADGLAVVDFEDFSALIPGASTSAGSRILLNELNGTVFQFESVHAVSYRFEGDCDAFWNWIQRGCSTVTRADHPID